MTRILFVCHGNICRKCRKASKIKGFRVSKMRYYTITTPISNWNLGVTTKKRSKFSEERGM